MGALQVRTEPAEGQGSDTYDAIVIGAGMGGIEQLYHLNKLGLSVKAFEAGDGVGGTWHWNRYPGARSDSEIYSYGFFWDEPFLRDWQWSEHFASSAEIRRYVNFAVDGAGLRPLIQLNARVRSARFDEEANLWTVTLEDGTGARCRFLVASPGILDAPYIPDFPGIDEFEGISFHSARWPDDLDLAGKRVAVIGTGATGVQIIQSIAGEVGHLTVFQRSPNFVAPLGNSPITEEEQADIKARWSEIVEKCRTNYIGFEYDIDYRLAADLSPEQRLAYYDEIWSQRGLRKAFANFYDHYTDVEANKFYTEYVREKLRARVNDPALAEKLIPSQIGFNYKRIPLETGYYEAFERDNVELVELSKTPIERVTRTGIMSSDREFEFDIIVYATGFDAVTGAMRHIDIEGRDGLKMADRWMNGPEAFLTVFVAGFPNLFTVTGACFGNIPRCFEASAEFVAQCIGFMRERGLTRVETTFEAEEKFMEEAEALGMASVINQSNSWFVGGNVEGKRKRQYLYAGGVTGLRAKYAEALAGDFSEGLVFA
jgi:cation diffusion facilitator CzcD-associated flavoprotein CzcO